MQTFFHRSGHLDLDRTIVMGILNVTPDSFSDGGRYLLPEKALEHALQIQEQGAGILDVGAQSTRPGAPFAQRADTHSDFGRYLLSGRRAGCPA